MNLRDREFPDRRGAGREAAPRSSRTAAALAHSAHALHCESEPRSLATVTTSQATAVSPMQILRGQAVSPGIAIGPVVVLDPRGLRLPPRSIAAETIGASSSDLTAGSKPHTGRPARTKARPAPGWVRNTLTSWLLIAG